jgi:hypothetical protein
MAGDEAAERFVVVRSCWLFTPHQHWNRLKRGKSRLSIAKNDIDHLIPTISIAERDGIPSSSMRKSAGSHDAARDPALRDARLRERLISPKACGVSLLHRFVLPLSVGSLAQAGRAEGRFRIKP